MSWLSVPKLIVLGLGVTAVLKLSVGLVPMAATAETPGGNAPLSVEIAPTLPAETYDAPAAAGCANPAM